MHRNLLQSFVLVGLLGIVLTTISFTTPRPAPVSDVRANPQPSTRQAAWAARAPRLPESTQPQEAELLSGAEPRSVVGRSATGPLRLIEAVQPVTVAPALPAASAMDAVDVASPPPAKPASVTNADIVRRLEHSSCKLPPYTKELAIQNLAAVGNLDPVEASRVWDTFDEFCRRDFSLFYEIQKSEDLARSHPTPEAPLPSPESLEGITLSPEAFRQVEAFISSIWQAQGYNSEFPDEGVLKARPSDALGAATPAATAPLGVQCGGGTIAPEGLGPNWWTCRCTGCCIPCKLGCCLPGCADGCAPRAYLWDSITGICGCGL